MKRKFSIRDVLMMTIIGLALLIFFLAARGVYDNWRRLTNIRIAAQRLAAERPIVRRHREIVGRTRCRSLHAVRAR